MKGRRMLDGFKKILGNQGSVGNGEKCILVVEDTEVDRILIEKTLIKQGYKVITENDGQAGLERACRERPDLILMDCDMPVMDGNEACKLLKEREETKDIPVVFLTSANTPKNIIDCFELDAENFLSKPIDPKVLYTQIKIILSESAVS